MRIIKRLQLFLRPAKVETQSRAELDEIGQLLENLPGIAEVYQLALNDLSGGKKEKGAKSLIAE